MNAFRRFWSAAAIAPHTDGWAVTLDGKTALTPAHAALATRHKRLAEGAAGEWAAAGEMVDPRAMPLTGFLNAVIDRVKPHRAALAGDVAAFAGSELVCYRTEGPTELAARQTAGWDPVLEWIAQRYDVRLVCGIGITPIQQPPAGLARLRAAISALDDYRLAAALKLTGIFKSLALTLAALEGEINPVAGYELSRIDEIFQAERWGEDAEAARRVALERAEVAQTAAYLALLDR